MRVEQGHIAPRRTFDSADAALRSVELAGSRDADQRVDDDGRLKEACRQRIGDESDTIGAFMLIAIARFPLLCESRANGTIDLEDWERRRRELRSSDVRVERQSRDHDREANQLGDALKREGLHQLPPL